MQEVTHWGKESWGSEKEESLCLPQLRVESHLPLAFGSPAEIEAERTREGLIHLFPDSDDPDDVMKFGGIWRRT